MNVKYETNQNTNNYRKLPSNLIHKKGNYPVSVLFSLDRRLTLQRGRPVEVLLSKIIVVLELSHPSLHPSLSQTKDHVPLSSRLSNHPHSWRTPWVYVTTGNLASLRLVSVFPLLPVSLQAEPLLVTGSWGGEKYHSFSHTTPPPTLGFVTLCSSRPLVLNRILCVCVCVCVEQSSWSCET